MRIRPAVRGDERGIAKVHVDAWRSTYAGLVPDSYLQSLSYEQRASLWERNLAYPGVRVFVAEEENGEIAGFISGGPAPGNQQPGEQLPVNQVPVNQLPRNQQSEKTTDLLAKETADANSSVVSYNAELTALYLLQKVQGRGIGRRLVAALFQTLYSEGMDAVHVWVLADNEAKALYQRLGAVETGREAIEIGGKTLIELGLVWDRHSFEAIRVLAETDMDLVEAVSQIETGDMKANDMKPGGKSNTKPDTNLDGDTGSANANKNQAGIGIRHSHPAVKPASWIYTYACHEDERELCGFELRRLLKEVPADRHVESAVYIDPSRSPFLHERVAVQLEGGSLEELEQQAGRLDLEGATFKVRYLDADRTETYEGKRALERRIGACIHGKADMKKPDRLLGLAYVNQRWVLGDCVSGESVWLKHNSKPRQYSTALSTRVARAVVNIAVPETEGHKLVDPCCGIGTVLIEALSMGIQAEGFDINPLAVNGARDNLRHFGMSEGAVSLADMRKLENRRYSSLILDLPYNLCSVLPEEELLDMLVSARRLAPEAVILTIEDILPVLPKAGWTIADSCRIYKGRFSRQLLICN